MQILAPVVRGRKGHYRELFEEITRDGFIRVRIDGVVQELEKGLQADRYKVHDIEIVVDRLVDPQGLARACCRLGGRGAQIWKRRDHRQPGIRRWRPPSAKTAKRKKAVRRQTGAPAGQEVMYSRHLACPVCDISYEDPAPNAFSFNSPYGACPICDGLGEVKELDLDLMIPDESLSINQEGLAPLGKPRADMGLQPDPGGREDSTGLTLTRPLGKSPRRARNVLLHGGGDERFSVEYCLQQRPHGDVQAPVRRIAGHDETVLRGYQLQHGPGVGGSLHEREGVPGVQGRAPQKRESCRAGWKTASPARTASIHQVVSLSIGETLQFFRSLKLAPRQALIAAPIVKEIVQRLQFLVDVGLEYLTLDRPARTLSGGEGQRIRLATQIGSQLVGVLYILDEPSIGLHQRDNRKLIASLQEAA